MPDVTVSGNTLVSNNYVVANFTNLYGQLQIQFANTGVIPTRALVDEVIQAIQYKNSSLNPAASVSLIYTFDDGSGAGSPSTATASTVVNITAVNNSPITVIPSGTQQLVENMLNQNVGTLHFSGNISISDPYAVTAETITLTANHGVLTFGNTVNLTNVVNGAASITATGAISDLNNALNGLMYTTNAGYIGNDIVQLVANNNNAACQLSAASNINITVSQVVNQTPVNTVPATVQHVDENSTLSFNGNLSVLDPNASTIETVTLTASNGQLAFGSTSNLTNVINDGNSITATGTITALNAALNGLTYNPNTNYFGTDTIQLTTANNNASVNGLLSATNTVNVMVGLPVDTPIITAPTSVSFNVNDVNGSYIFGGANAVAVSDVGGDNNLQSINLSVNNGKISLSNTSGITITSGANNSSTITFYGTISQINAALNDLTYTPVNGYIDSLSIITNNVINSSGTIVATSPKVASAINITAIQPIIHGLDQTSVNTYTEGGAAVVIDNHVTISGASNNASLTIFRAGGADPSDVFSLQLNPSVASWTTSGNLPYVNIVGYGNVVNRIGFNRIVKTLLKRLETCYLST